MATVAFLHSVSNTRQTAPAACAVRRDGVATLVPHMHWRSTGPAAHVEASPRQPCEAQLSAMGDAMLGGAADASLDAGFRAWFGRSGRRYIVSVHAMDAAAPACDYEGALLLAVRRDAGCQPKVLDMRDSGDAACAGQNESWVAAMRAQGANELHVHLLARDSAARAHMVRDLAA